MKIGIYGDSYASANSKDAVKWYELLARRLETSSNWFFKKKVTINHYALAGSSSYYTYKKFLQTHKENDLNIVLVTGPSRYTKELFLECGARQVLTTPEHVDQVLALYNDKLTSNEREELLTIKSWFKVIDTEYTNDMQELMLQKIQSLDKKAILYPCFSDSYSRARFKQEGLDIDINHMHVFWYRQLELLGIEIDNFSGPETTNLCGHLGPEFNEFFANMLYKRIRTGKWDHSGMLDVELKHPKDFYYKQ